MSAIDDNDQFIEKVLKKIRDRRLVKEMFENMPEQIAELVNL